MICRLLLISFILLLTSCGFHLRGSPSSIPLSFKTLSIMGETETNFAQNLVNIMRGQVSFVKAQESAQVIVELGPVQHNRSVSAKDSQGRVSEYRLFSNVTMQAYTANKDQLIPPVNLSTSYTLSTGNGYETGLDLEESRLYNFMDAELANKAQYRLRSIKLNPQP